MPNELYRLEFNEQQWEELISAGYGLFEFKDEGLTRRQWVLLATLLLGKAYRIDRGDYDLPFDGVADDDPDWADELRETAEAILAEFRPGDGRL